MEVMRVLGKTGWVSEDVWDARMQWLSGVGDTYFIVVILDEEGMVVASGALLLERKL
jgi:glucosamine-phosphate N-acetyltransferase